MNLLSCLNLKILRNSLITVEMKARPVFSHSLPVSVLLGAPD